MTTIIYSPSTQPVTSKTDLEVYDTILMFSRRFYGIDCDINNGKANLGRLDEKAGGTLYIVGHGNAGTKIGAHGHENATAPELVAQLLAEGMPKKPKNLICIHLYACCSATKVRVNYVGNLQEPFIVKFCEEMVKNGCSNFRVVGYIGILNPDGRYSLNYHNHKADKREWLGNMDGTPPSIHYTVNNGGYQKLGNDEWVQQVERRRHLMRKNSEVYTMVKR